MGKRDTSARNSVTRHGSGESLPKRRRHIKTTGQRGHKIVVPDDISRQRNASDFNGVTDPIAGEIYLAYWEPSNEWYAAVILPTGSFESMGISGSLVDTSLLLSTPKCYDYDKVGKKILGWSVNFREGGPKITKRKFPIMYLTDDLNIPQHGNFEIPRMELYDWISAEDLRPFTLKDHGQPIRGYQAAQAFYSRKDARKETETRSSAISANQDSRRS